MEKVLSQILEELKNLNNRMDSLDNRMDNFEIRLDKMELRIETEIIEKINVLSDGFELRGDQIEALKKHFDQRIDGIEIDTRYLVSKVARLEKMAK